MGITITLLERIFKYGEVELADPNPKMSIEDVTNYYCGIYPELTTATVSGPKIEKDKQVFEFKTVIGTKG